MPLVAAAPWAPFTTALADPHAHRYCLGLVFILLQCVVWILAAIITQWLYTQAAFSSPFLMTYTGMSLLALFLPARAAAERLGMGASGDMAPADGDDEGSAAAYIIKAQHSVDSLDHELAQAASYMDYLQIAVRRTEELAAQNDPRLATSWPTRRRSWDHRRHLLAAVCIAPAMFAADYGFNVALAHTSVASATVLVSTQSVFVFLLAVALRLEPYGHAKLAGVLLSVLGTALTALQDRAETAAIGGVDDDASGGAAATGHGGAFFGDMMALLAAVAYAVYTIQVRVLCPQDEALYSMPLLLGYIGLVCCIPLLPVALGIAANQVELSALVLGLVLLKGAMDFVVTDYLLFRAIVLTNATIATVGLGLTIPMAFFADWVAGRDIGTLLNFFGAVAVSVGFLIVNLDEDDSVESIDLRTAPLPTIPEEEPNARIV